MSSGILELLSKQLLAVREPIESHQKLLLPLLAKIGFVTKVVEVSKNDAVLSIMKATTFFGTISLLKSAMHTTSLGERIFIFREETFFSHRTCESERPVNVLINYINAESLLFGYLESAGSRVRLV